MALVKVAGTREIPPGKGMQVKVGSRLIAVFNIDGRYLAIDDQCTHRAASLAEGECEGAEVICPLHGARFDLTNGTALSPPAQTGVKCYQVQVIGEEVHVDA